MGILTLLGILTQVDNLHLNILTSHMQADMVIEHNPDGAMQMNKHLTILPRQ